MADNYLERRMEDLRSGRVNPSGGAGIGGGVKATRKGMVSFPMPEKRVLIIDTSTDGPGVAIAESFSRTGCRTALFHNKEMNPVQGIRCYPIADAAAGSGISDAFRNLLKAWRDIDVLIPVDPEHAELSELLGIWGAHKEAFPIPSEYGARIIPVECIVGAPEDAGPLFDALPTGLGRFGATVNRVRYVKRTADRDEGIAGSEATPEGLTRSLIFLSLPSSRHITHSTLNIGV